MVARPIEPADFNATLFLEEFKRIEGPGNQPFPQAEAIERTLQLLALTPLGGAPTPTLSQAGANVDNLIAHGKALSAQKQCAEALAFFERAMHSAPLNFDALLNKGLTLTLLRRHREALVAFDGPLALNPNSALAWNNKATALNLLGRYPEALPAIDRALALNPNLAEARNNQGMALYGLKRHVEAVAALTVRLSSLRWNARIGTTKR